MTTAIVVAGMGFGDEGKGSIVDYLAREYPFAHTVVRYNGGAQAGHNVVLDDGRHHCFSQFGAATFVRSMQTHLSHFMLVNPIFLMAEGRHLEELGISSPFERVTVDREALVTTPFHVAANRLRELYRNSMCARHGSCGMGIGETTSYSLSYPLGAIRIEDLEDPEKLRRKLITLVDHKRTELFFVGAMLQTEAVEREWAILSNDSVIDDTIDRFLAFAKLVRFVDQDFLNTRLKSGVTIFEGAQGALLDQDYGFHPHTTWTKCTLANAEALLEGFQGDKKRIGVLRAHASRHGAGPFPTEDKALQLVDSHNGRNPWQQDFRVGYFDFVLAKYGKQVLEVAGSVDEIALTHLDTAPTQFCSSYRLPTHDIHELRLPEAPAQGHLTKLLGEVKPNYCRINEVQELYSRIRYELKVPVTIESRGPTAEDKESL